MKDLELTFTEGLPTYDEVVYSENDEMHGNYVLLVKDYHSHNYLYLTVSVSPHEEDRTLKWWFDYKDDYLDDDLVRRVVGYCKLPTFKYKNDQELKDKYNKLEDSGLFP